jgi:hypothetical protein
MSEWDALWRSTRIPWRFRVFWPAVAKGWVRIAVGLHAAAEFANAQAAEAEGKTSSWKAGVWYLHKFGNKP